MKTCLAVLLSLISCQIWSQNLNENIQSEDELINSYDYFLNNPLDLNTCSKEQLMQIQFLTVTQINSFLDYRNQQVLLLHVFELQVIPDWDLSTCRKIEQFVTVNAHKNRAMGLKNSFILCRVEGTLEKAQGFNSEGKSNAYQGDRLKELIKIKNSSHSFITLGFIGQKDAGEKSLLDFYSAYVDITPQKHVQKLIIGDYSIQWGQGLLQAGGFNLGKNYESIKATQKFHLGGIPYSSSAESSFNRGIFISKMLNPVINSQFFISSKMLDGKTSVYNGQTGFKTIDMDGYHRNTNEIANQHTINEKKIGSSLEVRLSKTTMLQLNGVLTQYSIPKIPSGIDYKLNEWNGNKFLIWSISQTSFINNKRVINEIAFQNQKLSIIHGIALPTSKKQDFSYLFRYFSNGFYNPDGKALGENTRNENEIGLFIGHQFQISKRKKLSSYVDIFYFPEIKYQVSSPHTYGWEVLNRYQMERKNAFKLFNQFKWTSKEEDFTLRKNEKTIQRTHDVQESVDIIFLGKKWIQWHNRMMLHALFKKNTSYLGLMLLQDITFNLRKFEVKTRLAYTKTPNYDTRLYAFEPGLPYSFNLLSYSGHSFRLATTIEIPLSKELSFASKIGRTVYFDKNEIGSGTDVIQSNHKTDLSFQLIYKNL